MIYLDSYYELLRELQRVLKGRYSRYWDCRKEFRKRLRKAGVSKLWYGSIMSAYDTLKFGWRLYKSHLIPKEIAEIIEMYDPCPDFFVISYPAYEAVTI